MSKLHVAVVAACSVLAATSLAVVAERAFGQDEAPRVLEVVRVVAPRLVRHEEQRSAGSKTELVSLTRRVDISDLDLTLHRDVVELETRIGETAEEACAMLAEMFPFSSPETPDCVRRAVAGAMEEAEQAIAAAHE